MCRRAPNPDADFILVLLLYKSETVNCTTVNCRQLRLFFCYMAEKWSVSVTNKAIAGGPRRVFECPLPECSFIAMSTMALKVLLQILLHGSTFSTHCRIKQE